MNETDLTDKFFENSITDAEMEQLNALLKEDDALRADFAFQKALRAAYHRREREETRQMLQKFETAAVKRMSFSRWAVSVAAILLLATGGWFLFSNSSSGQQLYAENFQPYPNKIAPASRGGTAENLQQRAFYFYDQGAYKEAAVLFDSLFLQHHDAYALLYRANSLMAAQAFPEAISVLSSASINDEKLQYAFRWYLALAYLKQNERQKAADLLQALSAKENEFKKQAQALIKKLD